MIIQEQIRVRNPFRLKYLWDHPRCGRSWLSATEYPNISLEDNLKKKKPLKYDLLINI